MDLRDGTGVKNDIGTLLVSGALLEMLRIGLPKFRWNELRMGPKLDKMNMFKGLQDVPILCVQSFRLTIEDLLVDSRIVGLPKSKGRKKDWGCTPRGTTSREDPRQVKEN